MSKQTAVEWLKSQIEITVGGYFGSPWIELFEQAKAMEEEQENKRNKILMDFLDTEYELGISDKKTIERIKWYLETYFEQTYKEDKQ